MSDCEECGDSLVDPRDKNKAGWWRDRCLPCLRKEHGRLMTDGGWSATGRQRFTIMTEQTEDDRYRAWEEHSERDLYGRGETPAEAVENYCRLIQAGESDE